MMVIEQKDVTRRALTRVPRTRGAFSGLVIVVLGAWGALVPFLGPYFDFGYTHDPAWTWTRGRGWLEVLPGVVAVVGGLVLLGSRSRVTASAGAWLGVAAGAWFACGQSLAPWLHLGTLGSPRSSHASVRALQSIALFTGLGAVLIFFAAGALGRLSVRSLRDIRSAERELEHEHTQHGWRQEQHDTPAPASAPAAGYPAPEATASDLQTERVRPAVAPAPPKRRWGRTRTRTTEQPPRLGPAASADYPDPAGASAIEREDPPR